MPETLTYTPPVEDVVSVFRGLSAFQEEDTGTFFGRDTEIAELYQLIKSNTLTTVFGKSGTGKTSLLNAGVFPRLRKDNCLPFRIRLEFQEGSRPLVAQAMDVIRQQIEKYGFRISPSPEEETLWEFFHRENLWKIVTPVLVFDQFEELFTLAGKYPTKKQEPEMLITELSDLIENTIPDKLKEGYLKDHKKIGFDLKQLTAKVVIAFREDFLPEMESLTKEIPSVKYSRFRLKVMNSVQAREVIINTWGAKTIDASCADTIVSFLTSEKEKGTDPQLIQIEPSLLNQVCAYLDKARLHAHLDKISDGFLQRYSEGTTLKAIYHEAINESNAELARNGINPTQTVSNFVEDKLITEEGYRIKYSVVEISPALDQGINVLRRKYFIREEGSAIELTHDVIATIVKKDRDARRTADAKAEIDKKAKRKALIIVVIAALVGLTCAGYAWRKTNQANLAVVAAHKELVRLNENIAKARADRAIAQGNLDSANVRIRKAEESLSGLLATGANTTEAVNRLIAELQNAKSDSANAVKATQAAGARIKQSETEARDMKATGASLSQLGMYAQDRKAAGVSLTQLGMEGWAMKASSNMILRSASLSLALPATSDPGMEQYKRYQSFVDRIIKYKDSDSVRRQPYLQSTLNEIAKRVRSKGGMNHTDLQSYLEIDDLVKSMARHYESGGATIVNNPLIPYELKYTIYAAAQNGLK